MPGYEGSSDKDYTSSDVYIIDNRKVFIKNLEFLTHELRELKVINL